MTRIILVAATVTLGACGSDGTLRVLLTDAPLDGAEAVNVTITSVQVHHAGAFSSENDAGWVEIMDEARRVNLLDLRDGVTTTLGEVELPEGKITQVRMVVDEQEGPTLIKDGAETSLRIASGATSGIKLNGCFAVLAGDETDIVVDFDAGASVHTTGNGSLMMRPTVHLIGAVDCPTGQEELD